ncbi:hypothetical protein F5972_20900 [Microbispora cellulosiformans]|uniref:WD40 repeat domain-containing protein n=1 Tax=Microbispora cellulosiformans TaxID=2614688 RepID=A0A5J5K1V3_9ACTN|nr:hypothetical protein [Microbispora cellulosiformans]KAA9376922.1 hypothetical protein F5972_20900 [Microbispora cellulosiformans]
MQHPTRPITRGLTGLALTTLTMLTVLAVPALTVPAAAHARASHHMIRYASVDSCPRRDGTTTPCHTWRLDLLDGRRVALKDAMLWPLTAKGRPDRTNSAPLTVSGDGESVSYFRRSDHRLVVREFHGDRSAVRVMPRNPLPRGVGMNEAWLKLSQDGDRLALGYTTKDGRTRVRLFDVARASATGTTPETDAFSGFSGDGSAVLLQRAGDANTIGLSVHDDTGAELAAAVPPQIVANNGPWALSADDRTVAFVTGLGKKARLRFYDVATDQPTGSVGFSLPEDAALDMIDWTGGHEVTLHLVRARGSRDVVTVLRVDTETGRTRVRDSYKVRSGAFAYLSCGG